MKHVPSSEILSAIPVIPVMTRKERLEHWADLISQHDRAGLVHNLEYWGHDRLNTPLSEIFSTYYADTPFIIAARDPAFKAMGLGDTVASVMKFFEISQAELHEFSCDCGGAISSKKMAARVRYFANPTWLNWLRS